MPVVFLQKEYHSMPKGVRLLGMDVGAKTLGLALSDETQKIATPLKTIHRKKFTKDIEKIAEVVKEYNVGGFIIGYPVSVNGEEGRRCQSVRDFASEFINQANLPFNDPWIGLWDERFSTETVEEFVDKTVNKNKRRAKEQGIIDKLAAHHILQTALDFIQAKILNSIK